MENTAVEPSDTAAADDRTLEDLFIVPFDALTICRSIGPYGRLLGLIPGVCTTPSPDFLTRLLTPHPSHQAVLRKVSGDQFKNLENLIRGRHRVSTTTRATLAGRLKCAPDFLDELTGSAPDGPLMPGLQQLVQLFEGVPSWLAGSVLSVEIACPCCGHNVLHDVDLWWHRHAPRIGQPEYRFVERMLRALVGASICELIAHHLANASAPALGDLASLTNPDRHPIGNWLSEMLTQLNLESLSQLSMHMQLQGFGQNDYTHGRLRKWSSGQEAMPVADGANIAKIAGAQTSNERRLIAARTLAVATDLIMASTADAEMSNRFHAQPVLDGRLRALSMNTDLVFRHIQRRFAKAGAELASSV